MGRCHFNGTDSYVKYPSYGFLVAEGSIRYGVKNACRRGRRSGRYDNRGPEI